MGIYLFVSLYIHNVCNSFIYLKWVGVYVCSSACICVCSCMYIRVNWEVRKIYSEREKGKEGIARWILWERKRRRVREEVNMEEKSWGEVVFVNVLGFNNST